MHAETGAAVTQRKRCTRRHPLPDARPDPPQASVILCSHTEQHAGGRSSSFPQQGLLLAGAF